MYKYFISYRHEEGYGCCEITRGTLITGIEDIHSIGKTIEGNNGTKGVVVINFQLFHE